jgi:cell division protein FtsQ
MSDSLNQENASFQPEPSAKSGAEFSACVETGDALRPARRGGLIVRGLVFLILLAALVALAAYAAQWKKKVLVRGFVVDGASIVSDRELLSRMSDLKGSNLQKLDTGELKQRIMVLPYLREVEISKELNGIVRVKVFEREPVAKAVIDGRIMAVDGDGFLLPEKKGLADRFPDLLIIRGITRIHPAKNGLQKLDSRDVEFIRQFRDALSQSDYARLLIRELHLAPGNMSWCVAVQSPVRFIVGNDGNFKEKLKKFEIFWQKVISKKGFDSYETVDLRFRDRIFTRVPVSLEAPQDVSLR